MLLDEFQHSLYFTAVKRAAGTQEVTLPCVRSLLKLLQKFADHTVSSTL